MKSVNKIIAVSVMSMGLVSGLYCENRKLVAMKSTDKTGWSAIEVWQGGSTRESAAKFQKSTADKSTVYPAEQKLKYLFFDSSKGDVTIRFYWTASSGLGVEGGIQVPPFIRVYSVDQLLQEAAKRKDNTPRITIDCPFGRKNVDGCTMKPIPVAAGTVVQTQQAPAAVSSEAPIKYTKVKVVKTDPNTHGFKWEIKALSIDPVISRVQNEQGYPAKSKTYGTVNILKDTSLVSKLKVPNNKDFWILVSSNNQNDSHLKVPKVTPIKAGTIKSGSVININKQGEVTISK